MNEKTTTAHEKNMRRCFQLAELGESYVAPNPKVGAVLVYEDRIIGEGYHQQFGKAHAEVNCINSVAEEDKPFISKATLYVSLEPCSHHGKTPPCVDLILENKVPKVVISVLDIFDQVNGSGIAKLKANNIEVTCGILEAEGKHLLQHFLYFHTYKRPFITLKYAQSADGFMGIQNERVLISNDLSRFYLHQLRANHQAILVGKNTVLTDNPQLTLRHAMGKNPTRLVLASSNEIPENFHVNNHEAETIFIAQNTYKDLTELLHILYEKNIISVLVEGGKTILDQFIDAGLWDEAFVYTSSEKLNSTSPFKIKAPILQGRILNTLKFEEDTLFQFKKD